MIKNLSNQQKGSLLAFIAVFLITPDSLLIRLSNIETWGMLFYRGAIPFLFVLIGLLICNDDSIQKLNDEKTKTSALAERELIF